MNNNKNWMIIIESEWEADEEGEKIIRIKTYPCLRICPCTDFVDKFNKDFVDNLKE